MIGKIHRRAEEVEIKINTGKPKYMEIHRKCSGIDEIKLNEKNIEKVFSHINI